MTAKLTEAQKSALHNICVSAIIRAVNEGEFFSLYVGVDASNATLKKLAELGFVHSVKVRYAGVTEAGMKWFMENYPEAYAESHQSHLTKVKYEIYLTDFEARLRAYVDFHDTIDAEVSVSKSGSVAVRFDCFTIMYNYTNGKYYVRTTSSQIIDDLGKYISDAEIVNYILARMNEDFLPKLPEDID